MRIVDICFLYGSDNEMISKDTMDELLIKFQQQFKDQPNALVSFINRDSKHSNVKNIIGKVNKIYKYNEYLICDVEITENIKKFEKYYKTGNIRFILNISSHLTKSHDSSVNSYNIKYGYILGVFALKSENKK